MKLKNKKTGKIIEAVIVDHGADWEIRNVYADEHIQTYNSLAELNEEWEDAPEEAKEYWFMDYGGRIKVINDANDEEDVARKEIGNYFETKEEAEKAVEKLKAWNRLRECGLIPLTWTNVKGGCLLVEYGIGGPGVMDCFDFDLLFGGEE